VTGSAVTYRHASGPDDFASTYELFMRTANDLRARSHRGVLDESVARRTRALAFREHALAHDNDGFWLAEAGGERVGFGIATARPGFWHLNALHVVPEFQAHGVGRELLRRCLEHGRGPNTVSTVITEAAQPISNALYARNGMYQWLPLVHLECDVGISGDPVREPSVSAKRGQLDETTMSALRRIDADVLGFTRAVDHRFWIGLPDLTLVLLAQGEETVGYAYVSRFGGIGPCATRAPHQLPSLLAHSLNLAAEQGLQHVSLVVPGVATTALAFLLERGARYDESMTVLLTSQPFGTLDRYLLSASDALF
jgi:ribosomal protein S18 acetylase RimI-like enzyme